MTDLAHAYLSVMDLGRRVSQGRLGRYAMVRRLKRRLERALFPAGVTTVDAMGLRMQVACDGISLGVVASYRQGDYEGYMSELFVADVVPGARVLDVGASFGWYTLLAARAAGPSGRVLALEPSPAEFQLLQANVRANHFGNVTLVNRAAADAAGEALLHVPAEGYLGFNSLAPPRDSRHRWKTVTVPLVTVDSLAEPPRFDVVKIDVEGAEWEVLRGMTRVLDASPTLRLYIEFHPEFLDARGHSPKALLRWLAAWDFTIARIDDDRRRLEPIDLERPIGDQLDPSRGHNLRCVREGGA